MPEITGPIHVGKVERRYIGGGVISDPDRFLYDRPWKFADDHVVRTVYCKMAAVSANQSNRSYEQLSKDETIPVKVRAMFHVFSEMERAQRVANLKAGFEAREKYLLTESGQRVMATEFVNIYDSGAGQ